jgi:hypothetical protein
VYARALQSASLNSRGPEWSPRREGRASHLRHQAPEKISYWRVGQLVENPLFSLPPVKQSSSFQDSQVVGDGGLRHPESRFQMADAHLLLRKKQENLDSIGFTYCPEEVTRTTNLPRELWGRKCRRVSPGLFYLRLVANSSLNQSLNRLAFFMIHKVRNLPAIPHRWLDSGPTAATIARFG